MAVKWKWKAQAGGSVSPELQNKVNQNETEINTIKQKYVKKDEANTFTAGNNFNLGSNTLTYTSTNTAKADSEVLTRKDLTYVRKVRTNFTIPASTNNNGYATAEFTIDGLARGLNEFFVVMTTASVDISFEFSLQCNSLNWPNTSDIKVITTSRLDNSNIDNFGYCWIAFVVYGNNKIRFRAKNFHTGPLTITRMDIYHRRPAINAWSV